MSDDPNEMILIRRGMLEQDRQHAQLYRLIRDVLPIDQLEELTRGSESGSDWDTVLSGELPHGAQPSDGADCIPFPGYPPVPEDRKLPASDGALTNEGAEPEPFIVGNQYRTQGGRLVRFVEVQREGKLGETMKDEGGCHRYTNQHYGAGRVTGSAHDFSHPDNVPPLYRHASILKDCEVRSAASITCTCPSGDGSLHWPCPVHPPVARDAILHEQLMEIRRQYERANFVQVGKLLNACLDRVKELNS